MKIKNKILTLIAGFGITACSDDVSAPTYTVGEADNAITLRAGISEGGAGVMSRAGAEDHHTTPGHVNFTSGTQLRLRVDGTWAGHDPVAISKTTTASTGDQTGADNLHNKVTFSTTSNPVEQLYWDDYGTADPDNTTGRTAGLTIYGVAVEGKNAPAVSDWTSLSWTLDADQTGGWASKDLLTSNNIRQGGDGAYKFDDAKNSTGSNLIEFTHAMSMVTVELTAGEGFNGWSSATPNAGKFTGAPTVTLKNFKYKGTVSVEGKTSVPTDEKSDISMHLASGGANNHQASFDAIVFPGNEFDNATEILTLTADGNTFTVTAAKLNAAIQKAITENATTGYPLGTSNLSAEPKEYDLRLLQGWNYKLKITVNKTGITVVATIVDWDEVEADEEAPKIRITDSFGQTGTAFEHDFDFFRSLQIDQAYSKDAYVEHTEPTTGNHSYTFHDQLYWPDHSTHYFFRGVYPRVQTASEAGWIPSAQVASSTSSAATIAVQNVAYAANTYPSDLAIGYPRTTTETCTAHSKTVATQGICATEGTIRMNFEYVMSQVEVKLTSAAGDGHVNIDENTVIKIVGGYTAGNISMQDGSAACTGDKADYTMLGGTALDRLDAIVPQALGDMKFVIIVKNDEDNYDNYECRIAGIQVGGSDITAWEPGKKYVYTLEIQKTAIKTMATLKDWVTVNASENIWF